MRHRDLPLSNPGRLRRQAGATHGHILGSGGILRPRLRRLCHILLLCSGCLHPWAKPIPPLDGGDGGAHLTAQLHVSLANICVWRALFQKVSERDPHCTSPNFRLPKPPQILVCVCACVCSSDVHYLEMFSGVYDAISQRSSLATASAAILVHIENLQRLCTKMAAIPKARECIHGAVYAGFL